MSDLPQRLRSYADWLVSCALGNIPEEAATAYEAASRISQQDAELERMRRELAEAEKKFETADKLRVFWNDKAIELSEFIRAKSEETGR